MGPNVNPKGKNAQLTVRPLLRPESCSHESHLTLPRPLALCSDLPILSNTYSKGVEYVFDTSHRTLVINLYLTLALYVIIVK